MNTANTAYDIGDLVKYYDMYAEGIVSGAGHGIVLRIRTYSFGSDDSDDSDDYVPDDFDDFIDRSAQPASTSGAFMFASNAGLDKNNEAKSHNCSLNIYLVYRFKEQNIDWYENHNLELISKADNNPGSRS